MHIPSEHDVNLLLIDNRELLLAGLPILAELRRRLIGDRVCCLAAGDSQVGRQLWLALEIDVVVIAVPAAEELQVMIADLKRLYPRVVVVLVGREQVRSATVGVRRETGCHWISIRPLREQHTVCELVQLVRLVVRNKSAINFRP
jgi:hypothetical protein